MAWKAFGVFWGGFSEVLVCKKPRRVLPRLVERTLVSLERNKPISDTYKIFTKPEFTTLKVTTSGFQGSQVPSLTPFDITHAKSLGEIPAVPRTATAESTTEK